jgi:selenocysteine lyase/cysteine desulfurase
MSTRRTFLAGAGIAGLLGPAFRHDALARAAGLNGDAAHCKACELAANEDYWSEIARAFDNDRSIINFNNGGVCPTPTHVLEQMIRDLRFTNESPAKHMWQILEPRVETVRRELARVFGCDTEEIAITRNASESMETLVFGIDLKAGDEVIVTDQNYGRMILTWEQRARREGIVVKKIAFPIPLASSSVFVEKVRKAITPKTRVIEFPHITNLSGQILPVREVVRLAREKGIEVFVDGAHSFAHFPFQRDDLECDYFGCSLHKWLLAPIGTGFLYVRKEKQKSIWPLMAAAPAQDNDIRKFEEIGTHPAANHNAIVAALAFHRAIGAERKIARLRYLRDRWAKALLETSPRFTIRTPLGEGGASGAIGLVQVEGIDSGKLTDHLWEKDRIVTIAIKHAQFEGIRVTPNVYTTPDEVDVFIDAMKRVAAKGV